MHATFRWREPTTGKEYHLESMDLSMIPREGEHVDLVFTKPEASRDLSVMGAFLVERVKHELNRILMPGDSAQSAKKDRHSVSIYLQPLDPMAIETVTRIKHVEDQEKQKVWEAGKKQKNNRANHV